MEVSILSLVAMERVSSRTSLGTILVFGSDPTKTKTAATGSSRTSSVFRLRSKTFSTLPWPSIFSATVLNSTLMFGFESTRSAKAFCALKRSFR
ncbi:MAG: hypothetical protein FD137_2647, partial [Spirochaetes bacterium]